ncbi:type II toxin-antitoxin system HicA family toxin [Patescibacteria group bacterium]|nr:type II toxin-antitoxin system HicA family toxin [Patescibacteria group bacterium]
MPILKPRDVIRILKKIGFVEARTTGSHLILVNKEPKKIIPVPIHSKDIKRGLLIKMKKRVLGNFSADERKFF